MRSVRALLGGSGSRLRAKVLALSLLAGGCAQGPPPTFYLLDAQPARDLAGVERGVAVGVGPVELPPHLDRPQIVTRATPHRLELSEAHQWAEPLKANVSRVIAANLSNLLSSNRVYLVPRRERTELDFEVGIDIARLDGRLGEEVALDARWSLREGGGGPLVLTRLSIIREVPAGGGYADLVAAESRALRALSVEIADAIRTKSR